jgi:hypothetical protein
MPGRIETERVDAAIRLCTHDAALCFRERPARIEQVERLGEDIVVDEARINRERTHEQYDVSPANIPLSAEPGTKGEMRTRRTFQGSRPDLRVPTCAH